MIIPSSTSLFKIGISGKFSTASFPIFEKNFSLVEVYGADEAFLTGTFGAQVPVGSVDGRTIGKGLAGDITKRIRSAYFDLIEKNTQC